MDSRSSGRNLDRWVNVYNKCTNIDRCIPGINNRRIAKMGANRCAGRNSSSLSNKWGLIQIVNGLWDSAHYETSVASVVKRAAFAH